MTTVTLDKPRTLKFRITDVVALERDLGYGIDELQRRGQRYVALVSLLYYGLRHEDAALSQTLVEKKLQRFIDQGGDITAIVEQVYGALFDSGVYGKRLQDTAREVQRETTDADAAPAREEDGDPLPSSAASSGDDGRG